MLLFNLGNTIDLGDLFTTIIAFISLVVAVLTFCSQKKTQENTTPAVNMDIQKTLWLSMIKQFYYKMQYLYALRILLEECDYKKKPEERCLLNLCIRPDDYIHEELFYAEEYKNYYSNVHWIKKHLEDFNIQINIIVNRLNNENIKSEKVDYIFSFLDDICLSCLEYYQKIFKIESKEKLKDTLNKELFDKQKKELDQYKEPEKKEEQEKTRINYNLKDAFIKYFKDIDKFADDYYDSTTAYIEYYLKEKKERISLVDY